MNTSDTCTCAEIAEVAGFRLTDDQIKALCDLASRVISSGSGGER